MLTSLMPVWDAGRIQFYGTTRRKVELQMENTIVYMLLVKLAFIFSSGSDFYASCMSYESYGGHNLWRELPRPWHRIRCDRNFPYEEWSYVDRIPQLHTIVATERNEAYTFCVSVNLFDATRRFLGFVERFFLFEPGHRMTFEISCMNTPLNAAEYTTLRILDRNLVGISYSTPRMFSNFAWGIWPADSHLYSYGSA